MNPTSNEQAHLIHDMQFGEVTDEPLAPELFSYGLTLYDRVRKAYEAADEPLGPSDEAMLIWFSFAETMVDYVSVPVNS